MKKIFYTIFMSAVIVAAVTSCNKDDEFDSEKTTMPSGYVSQIKFTNESSDGEGNKEYKTSTTSIIYDAKKRVRTTSYIEVETPNESKTITYTIESSHEYEDDVISIFVITKEVTNEIIDNVAQTSTVWDNGYMTIELDSNGVIAKRTEYGNGFYDEYYFESVGDKVVAISRKQDGKDDVTDIGLATWVNDNVYVLGDDYFEFSTTSNDCNIDINMLLTASEEMSIYWGSEYVGFLTEIKGIHSANMISSCSEEGCDYEIIYTTNSNGKIIQAKWDKYGKGDYCTVDLTYYE